MDEIQRNELAGKIEKAFSKVRRPANSKVGDPDDVGAFIGKKRGQVTIEDINSVQFLPFFSPPAFHYYLPAFMCAVIQQPDLVDSMIPPNIIRSLTPPPEGKTWLYFDAEMFSPPEKEAILAFFENYEQLINWPIDDEDQQILDAGLRQWRRWVASDLLAQSIEDSFAKKPYPYDVERFKYLQYHPPYLGNNWWEVPVSQLRVEHMPIAFEYYLPAYLLGCARFPHEIDEFVPFELVKLLGPLPEMAFQDQLMFRGASYREAERKTIQLFFEKYEILFPYPEGELTPVEQQEKTVLTRGIAYWQQYEDLFAELKALREKLTQQVENAFADVRYPGDKGIGDEFEVGAFIGKDWRDIPASPAYLNVSLRFFWGGGLRFYLPAYLIALINDPEAADTAHEFAIWFLANKQIPSYRKQDKPPWLVTLFTPEQRSAILAFLEAYEHLWPLMWDDTRDYLAKAIEFWRQYI